MNKCMAQTRESRDRTEYLWKASVRQELEESLSTLKWLSPHMEKLQFFLSFLNKAQEDQSFKCNPENEAKQVQEETSVE